MSLPSSEYISDNYIMAIDNSVQSSTYTRLYYLSSTYYQNIAYNYNYGNKALYFRNNNQGSFNYCYSDLYFNNSGNINRQDNWYCFTASSWLGIMGSNFQWYIISTNYPYFTYTRPTWDIDSFSIDNGNEYVFQSSQIPINFLNGTRYNINVTDYYASPIPIIYVPQVETLQNKSIVTFTLDNYTLDSNNEGYFIRIVNNTEGTTENISPLYNSTAQTITKEYFENTNVSFQIFDREDNIIQEYQVNVLINYEENTDYSISIREVDNSRKRIYYDYIIKNSTENVYCFYSINNGNFIQNSNCLDPNTTYTLNLTNNGNVTWEIRDENSNVLYKYSQNFIFDISSPYITFKDNFSNNFLNLDILINRYQSGDSVEYSINNGTFISANLEDYSVSQSIKYFTINNLSNNDIVNVKITRNNSIVASAKYTANYVKYINSSSQDFNISNIFERVNINNISATLREYISLIGNIIMNSKIGNLLLLETFILIIKIVIQMIKR